MNGKFKGLYAGLLFLLVLVSCKVTYSFKDVTFPPDIKTVKVNFFENKARYINPQFAPRLNERFQQKMVSQTPLKRITNEEADYVISGYVSEYSVSTSGISNQRVSTSNLNVGVHITLKNNKIQKTEEYDVNKAFPFNAQLSLQEAENALLDEIIRGMTDEIFNRIFSAEW